MGKQTLPVPVVLGVVALVLVVVVAFFFVKSATAEPHTPRPDPRMFAPKGTAAP
jgi:hypothetical protein